MKIACTLLGPTSGTVLLDGRDVAQDRDLVRSRLGYLGQDWGAPKIARCWEVLDLVLRLRGVESRAARRREVERLLALVGLAAQRDRKVRTLSGGMVRRLGVAQALAGEPELIVMDEPTVGLDPDERVAFRNVLTELGQERTVVLSTHVVADVGTTCETVAILDRGRLVEVGPPSTLTARARGRVFEVVAAASDEARVREHATVVSSIPGAAGTIFRIVGDAPAGLPATEVEPSLEDAYLLLVPEAQDEVAAEKEAA
jgi:ABC-type multidrug transport system ATPase subunit